MEIVARGKRMYDVILPQEAPPIGHYAHATVLTSGGRKPRELHIYVSGVSARNSTQDMEAMGYYDQTCEILRKTAVTIRDIARHFNIHSPLAVDSRVWALEHIVKTNIVLQEMGTDNKNLKEVNRAYQNIRMPKASRMAVAGENPVAHLGALLEIQSEAHICRQRFYRVIQTYSFIGQMHPRSNERSQ